MASRRPLLLTLTIFVITAVIVTLPAFSGNFLKLTMDGGIHLSRLESVFGAFSVGKLPPLVNFIGLDNHVNAFNGMYPWFSTALFFTLPRLILGSPMQSMFIGPDLFTKICKIPIKHMHHAFDGYFVFSPFKYTKRASALV